MRAHPLFLAALLPSVLHAQDSAREIVDRVDRLLRGNSSHGTVIMRDGDSRYLPDGPAPLDRQNAVMARRSIVGWRAQHA